MRVAIFYFALFGALGVLLPYLPPYLRSLGLSGSQIGLAGALSPLAALIAPPLWGYLADRLQNPTRVLRFAALGATLAFAPLLLARELGAILPVLAGYALFASGVTPLADSVAVVEARRTGIEWARLRLWGSVGFIVTAAGFGVALARSEPGLVVPVGLVLIATYAATTLLLRPVPAAFAPPSLKDVVELASRPPLLAFLASAMLHWAAAAPFHQFFAIHLSDLGLTGRHVGAGIAIGVGAEVLVMWRYRSLARRLPVTSVLALAYAAGFVRWLVMAFAESGPLVVAIQALHGVSFGAFFVASITYLESNVPGKLRSTGRALFSAAAFGLGGIGGMLLAGRAYDAGGGRLAYLLAAGLELLAPLGLLAAARLAPRPALEAVPRGS